MRRPSRRRCASWTRWHTALASQSCCEQRGPQLLPASLLLHGRAKWHEPPHPLRTHAATPGQRRGSASRATPRSSTPPPACCTAASRRYAASRTCVSFCVGPRHARARAAEQQQPCATHALHARASKQACAWVGPCMLGSAPERACTHPRTRTCACTSV